MRSWLVLVGCLSLGCGPQANDVPEGGGDGSSGPASSSTGGDVATSSSTGAASSSSGELLCAGFENDEAGPPIEFTVRNATDAPIFLQSQFACDTSYLQLADPGETQLEWRTDGWLVSCEEFLGGDPLCGGPGCSAASIRLEPGGVYTEQWPGFAFEMHTLDPACLDEASEACGNRCFVTRQVPAGEYTATVQVARDADCGDVECIDFCEVDLGPGACEMFYFDDILGEREDVVVQVDYPSAGAAEFVIE